MNYINDIAFYEYCWLDNSIRNLLFILVLYLSKTASEKIKNIFLLTITGTTYIHKRNILLNITNVAN